MMIGQFSGKSEDIQETGCSAGPGWGHHWAAASPEDTGKWVTKPGNRDKLGCGAGHWALGQGRAEEEAGWEKNWVLVLVWITGLQVPPFLFPPYPVSASGFIFAMAQEETWGSPTQMVSNLGCTLIHGTNKGTLSQEVNV